MKLSELQQICLQKMCITVFEDRLKKVSNLLVCVEALPTEQTRQLLSRMLTALKWVPDQCNIIWSAQVTEDMLDKSMARKAIVFSEREPRIFEHFNKKGSATLMVVLPSLNTLLTDLQAKKVAWQKMQPLIESLSS